MMVFRAKKISALENTAVRTWILILLHGIVMLAILLFCDVKYEVSDDFVMELIASGAFSGTPDAHLMFCSYLWGQFLTVLYRLCGGVSWYFFAQIAVCFFSCCALSYYLAHTMRFPLCILVTVFIAAFFSRDMYLLPQFTKTAAIAIASGGCLFTWSVFYQKGKGCTLAGAALVILGCLLRHNAIYVVGAYLFIYVLFETICLFRKHRRDLRKKARSIYAAGGILLLLIFALRWCNNMAYKSDQEYRYYIDYSYARALIVDYPLPEYSVCGTELEKIGISENDYQLIRSWSFGDRTVFSLERMQQVLSVVDQYRPSPCPSFPDVIRRFFGRGILSYPGTLCCMMLAVIGLCMAWKRFWVSAAAGAVTVCLMLYFIHLGHSVYRVEFGYLFAAAILIIYTLPRSAGSEGAKNVGCPKGYTLPRSAGSEGAKRTYLAYLLAFVIIGWQIGDYFPDRSYQELTDSEYRDYVDSTFDLSWDYLPEKYTKTVNKRDIRPNFWKEVQEHPENLYLLDFNTTIQSLYYDISPFDSLQKGALGNMVYLGGVTVNHPVIKETLEKWQVENELPALLRNNIYFVSNTTSEEVLQFLREHYDPGATMTLYKSVDGYDIWSYEPSV